MLFLSSAAFAQNSRPRRVRQPASKPAEDPLLRPEPQTNSTARTNPNAPLLEVQPVKPVVNTAGGSNTTHAYQLLQQKQFAAAAKEAREISTHFPNDVEPWKIAGFAELNLKQYNDAMKDLEKAVNLQKIAKQDDPNTADALAQAYVLSEKFDQALPLLVTATTRAGVQPDATMLYYRGLSEYKLGQTARR